MTKKGRKKKVKAKAEKKKKKDKFSYICHTKHIENRSYQC